MPATGDDIAYFARRRWPDEQGRRLYADLAEEPTSASCVAKDAGTPVGIALARIRDGERDLLDLFVEPRFTQRGIGRRLLREMSDDDANLVYGGLVDPQEGGALALLLRRGAAPHAAVIRVAGEIARERELAQMAAGQYRFAVAELDPQRDARALAGLDREVWGAARPHDHAYFARGARGIAFELDGEFVGYAYLWPSGYLGPLLAASPAYLVQFFAYALAAMRRDLGSTWCTLALPARNVRIARAALAAGLRFDGVRLYAGEGAGRDLSRYVGFHDLLF